MEHRFPNFFRAFSAKIAPNPPQSSRLDGHLIRGQLIVLPSPPENSQIFQSGYFFGLLLEHWFPARGRAEFLPLGPFIFIAEGNL
jgi:hypothetical protein